MKIKNRSDPTKKKSKPENFRIQKATLFREKRKCIVIIFDRNSAAYQEP